MYYKLHYIYIYIYVYNISLNNYLDNNAFSIAGKNLLIHVIDEIEILMAFFVESNADPRSLMFSSTNKRSYK